MSATVSAGVWAGRLRTKNRDAQDVSVAGHHPPKNNALDRSEALTPFGKKAKVRRSRSEGQTPASSSGRRRERVAHFTGASDTLDALTPFGKRPKKDRWNYYSSPTPLGIKSKCTRDALGIGIDPTSLLQAHVLSSKTNGVEESLPTFCPEVNGYDIDFVASLPPDAPPDHIAFSKTRCGVDSLGTRRAIFYFSSDTGLKIPFQVTEKSTGGSLYAAFRIARHCYLQFEKGLDKDSVVALRNELASKLQGKFVPKLADPMEAADVAEADATAKKKMRVGETKDQNGAKAELRHLAMDFLTDENGITSMEDQSTVDTIAGHVVPTHEATTLLVKNKPDERKDQGHHVECAAAIPEIVVCDDDINVNHLHLHFRQASGEMLKVAAPWNWPELVRLSYVRLEVARALKVAPMHVEFSVGGHIAGDLLLSLADLRKVNKEISVGVRACIFCDGSRTVSMCEVCNGIGIYVDSEDEDEGPGFALPRYDCFECGGSGAGHPRQCFGCNPGVVCEPLCGHCSCIDHRYHRTYPCFLCSVPALQDDDARISPCYRCDGTGSIRVCIQYGCEVW